MQRRVAVPQPGGFSSSEAPRTFSHCSAELAYYVARTARKTRLLKITAAGLRRETLQMRQKL